MLSDRSRVRAVLSMVVLLFSTTSSEAVDPLDLKLRYQQESSLNSGRFHQLVRDEKWKPEETAIIVCDVWDAHHCLNAVRRLEEFVPRLNNVLNNARDQGVTIIHSPSDCMPAYEKHPARLRAIKAPTAGFVPDDCAAWCSIVPAEERAAYPIDQSDGGEDDDPAEHAKWAAKLKSMGRNPGLPWQRQTDMITIDSALDFISDKGDEVWNVLQQQGIRNVILTGVHTNMCVLGRPFGLRQMARNGKNVVLMRDMTDTMYNPKRWPYVSHFTGTDLIVSHIERYICPTITSDQFLGGKPFQFKNDTRPHMVLLVAEDEYQTEQTLPKFAADHLGRDFRITTIFGSDTERNSLPGIDAIKTADALLVSVRRRVLPNADMQIVRDFVKSGKPVIGIRTASHAFSLRNKQPPEGFSDWVEFDAEVFGGNYHGHHGNDLKSKVTLTDAVHEITTGLAAEPTQQGGSLYQTSPLADSATVLTIGSIEGQPEEPVTWTFTRKDGGRSFYSSMGHVDDFSNAEFTQLLYQGICWAAEIMPTTPIESDHWSTVEVPDDNGGGANWYRCAVRLPSDWTADGRRLHLDLQTAGQGADCWIDGHKIDRKTSRGGHTVQFKLDNTAFQSGDACLIVIRLPAARTNGFGKAPVLQSNAEHDSFSLLLQGTWQKRSGIEDSFANIPLPAKFGASADIVFTPPEGLWTARAVTRPGEFTTGIEGPACDADGNIFAVNFGRQGTIGRVSPNGSGEVFVTLPVGSVGNGIRFGRDGYFFVADYAGHNILRVNPATREITKLAHNDAMNQPNDLAIAPDGTLYASDPNWSDGTGKLWRIDMDGTTTLLAKDMGTTNGIDVSPDGKTLFVNESKQRNVWAFDIDKDRNLNNKRLIKKFPDHGFDGMRCDVDGNLYITRHGKGTVVKMTPLGAVLQEINVLGSKPSNLCFGGADGRTVHVTEVDGRQLVSFRVDRPGRSWGQVQK